MSNDDRTLGGHWQSPVIADNLAPGQPPHPSVGVEGPPLALPLQQWEQHLAEIRQLGQAVARQGFDYVAGSGGGNLDASGNGVFGIYQVASGVQGILTRLVVNSRVPGTNVPYTPAVPFSAAAAWIGIYAAEDPTSGLLGDAGLLDFGPVTAAGPIFPGLFTDDAAQAAFVRGPYGFVLRVVAGPVSAPVAFRYQVILRRSAGIA